MFLPDMPKSVNKYLVYGLFMLLALSLLFGEARGNKLLFCKHCRSNRSISDPSRTAHNSNDTLQGNIISAPSRCKAGFVLDKRNICRRLV